ncbi:replication endonuclease [Gluconobacter cerinus]|uniref:replication endonuclease n=1 Tax=Gluconobacter cerinus TaxID=38307 RepID=UPI001B8C06A6|nr:replication endonuclease [Gluconobacter cerinus]MBS0984520.1 replication endonuclease [Gluconobacter cerinus]
MSFSSPSTTIKTSRFSKVNRAEEQAKKKAKNFTTEMIADGYYEDDEIIDEDVFEACRIIDIKNYDVLIEELIENPKSLPKLAFHLKHKIDDTLMNADQTTIAWKYLLRLDSILSEYQSFSHNKNIWEMIDDIKEKIEEETDNSLIHRAREIIERKEYIGKEIARQSRTNLKTITTKLSNLIYDIPKEPERHENYGYSFSQLCFYLSDLKKLLNKIIEETKDIKRFAQKAEELIGDIIDYHRENGTLNIIDGNEDAVKHATDLQVSNGLLKFWIETRKKEVLTKEEISKGLRVADRSNISRKLRAIGRQGMADLASALGLVNGREGNPHHHCHLVVANHKKEMLIKGKRWAEKVAIRRDINDEGISLWSVIKSKQSQGLASMYTIIKGYEEHAKKIGYKCFFGTLTNDGAFHSAPKSMNYRRNPNWKYKEHNLLEARKALSEKVSKLRARISKTRTLRGFFGLKTYEFHKDGTLHAHFMFWLPETYIDKKTQDYKDTYSLLSSHVEALAPGYGHDLRVIEEDAENEENRASPTSYIMKYITKGLENIDPENMEADSEFCKYKAMLSASGARAFSFVGCRGIRTLWNRLYNTDEQEFENLGEEWNEIIRHVQKSKMLWNQTKDMDLETDEEDILGIKKESREHSLKALELLNVFPTEKQRYKIIPTFEKTNNRFLEETKKQTGWKLITEHEEEFILPYKKFDVEVYSLCSETEADVTGFRTKNKRKEVLDRLSCVINNITGDDLNRILGIYNNKKLLDIHRMIITDLDNNNLVGEYVDEYGEIHDFKEKVSLIFTNPRNEASPHSMNSFDCLESEEDTKKDAQSVGIIALEALRHLYEPHICP